ncbi:MAG: outer membrane lipoprotein carrier protein LolA [Holosporaceae bacterium]|jgi:outer membrane lipoprotein-sorting protein|nr:outer membrane lipoprotein carrier protein LolA [Holosporaceae bacterium]
MTQKITTAVLSLLILFAAVRAAAAPTKVDDKKLLCSDVFFAGVKRNAADYLEKVEKYFNGITTFESDFVQIDGRGRCSVGRFFLKRPRLMKMDYQNPPTHVIIAKNNRIVHYDRELKERTETSMYSSPLSFLLSPEVNLRKHLKILSIREESDAVFIKFRRKNEDIDGAVILVFSKNPLTLRKWILLENENDEHSDGNIEVSLLNWKLGHDIPSKVFDTFN